MTLNISDSEKQKIANVVEAFIWPLYCGPQKRFEQAKYNVLEEIDTLTKNQQQTWIELHSLRRYIEHQEYIGPVPSLSTEDILRTHTEDNIRYEIRRICSLIVPDQKTLEEELESAEREKRENPRIKKEILNGLSHCITQAIQLVESTKNSEFKKRLQKARLTAFHEEFPEFF